MPSYQPGRDSVARGLVLRPTERRRRVRGLQARGKLAGAGGFWQLVEGQVAHTALYNGTLHRFGGTSMARWRIFGVVTFTLALGFVALARAQTETYDEVVLADNFDDPALGFLPGSSPNPTRYEIGYVGGEYLIRRVDASFTGASTVQLPGQYADASIAVDVRLVGSTGERYVRLACREQTGPDSEYRFLLRPGTREFRLERWDRGRAVVLQDWRAAAAIRGGNEKNGMELSCMGATISASVNGTQVGSVLDDTYLRGTMELGLFGAGSTAEARFDNLVVVGRFVREAPPQEEAAPSEVVAEPAPEESAAPEAEVVAEEPAAEPGETVAEPAALPPPAPEPTAAPPPTPTLTPAPRPGDILLTDNFNDPAAGFLPRASPDPARYLFGYVDGEYMIRRVDASYTGASAADLPGIYADASIALDARLVGTPGNAYVRVSCREQAGAESEYRFAVRPGTREFRIERRDRGTTTALLDWRASGAIREGTQTNRLELSCVGNRISGGINGTEVGVVQDDTYRQGRIEIGLFASRSTAEARFDNLVVTQR